MGKKKTYKEFVEIANQVWDNRFQYGEEPKNFVFSRSEVQIFCPEEEHGWFPLIATNHVTKNKHRNPAGCPICFTIADRKKKQKPYIQFLKDARAVHGDLFEYNKETYDGAKVKMEIYCQKYPKHKSFWMSPDVHINHGDGCRECYHAQIVQKYKEEAEANGLIYLSDGDIEANRLYKFKLCGHQQNIQPTNVRHGTFQCQTCIIENFKKEAERKNLTFLGKGRSADYKKYKFNECGHIRDIEPKSVRNTQPLCKECLQDNLLKNALKENLIYLGNSSDKNKNKKRYRFKDCGHEADLYTSSVTKGHSRCDLCYNEQFVKDAEQAGLILKGLGRDGNYRLYKFEECGHEQEIQIVHVRNHNFVCNICETTSRDLPSYVYILKISYESKIWLKLGYAKFINARVKGFGLPTSATVDLICSSEFKTGRLAHEHESAIHSKYIKKRNDPSKMKEYHAWSGHNECYPMEMLENLKSELNTVD